MVQKCFFTPVPKLLRNILPVEGKETDAALDSVLYLNLNNFSGFVISFRKQEAFERNFNLRFLIIWNDRERRTLSTL